MANPSLTPVLDQLLNRGVVSSSETAFFQNVTHETQVDTLARHLNAHRRFLNSCHIEVTQALNDKGVDLLLEASGIRIGFQIKSHFDATEKDFNRKVKAQFTEALSFGLHHYYVMICCSMLKASAFDYGMKATHLQNELTLIRGVAFTVFGPRTTASLFRAPPIVTRQELLASGVITDEALHDHELGYEHLPEIYDSELALLSSGLGTFGDCWFDSQEGQELFNAHLTTLHRKQIEQFTRDYLPTLPADVRITRSSLVKEIQTTLRTCRDCDSWSDRSEYKLSNWMEHVPEKMIPYTSLQNLHRIHRNLGDYLKLHREMKQS